MDKLLRQKHRKCHVILVVWSTTSDSYFFFIRLITLKSFIWWVIVGEVHVPFNDRRWCIYIDNRLFVVSPLHHLATPSTIYWHHTLLMLHKSIRASTKFQRIFNFCCVEGIDNYLWCFINWNDWGLFSIVLRITLQSDFIKWSSLRSVKWL